jgi:predicted aldo/keto reductase-like oxidoreductase
MYYEPEPFEQVVNAAIDAGITYLDTAYIYDVAELRLAPILAKRRDEVFLVTKTWVQSKDQALASLEKSIQLMEVDSVDLTLIHNVGGYEREQVLGKNGSLAGLLEARKRGWTKHIGCSGHCFPDKFVPVIDTGEIDLVMCAMNFVHEHVYGFQERVVPTVVKHDAALVCMKVYGGATGGWGGYAKGNPGRLASAEYRQDAVDYALSIPHVSTCVVGMKTLQELQAGIVAFRNHRPLDGARREEVIRRGKELAEEWGPQFGAVT